MNLKQVLTLVFILLPLSIVQNIATAEPVTDTSLLSSAPKSEKSQVFAFKVFLDNREMGRHEVIVKPDLEGTRVTIAADFEVKILFYTAFTYQHRVEELWRDQCLVSISATTDNNGEALFLEGKADVVADQLPTFEVKSHLGDTTLQGCIRSFAYWDLELLKSAALLNMQTSEYEPTSFNLIGRETLVMNNQEFIADKYKLTVGDKGDKDVFLWYSTEGEWLSLQSRTEKDHLVSYYLESAYEL